MRLSDNDFAKKFTDKYPVITVMIPDWETINPLLEEGIRAMGDQWQHKTNVKASMTDFKMWEEGKPAYEHFQNLAQYAGNLALQNAPKEAQPHFQPVVTEIWGAVYKKDEYTIVHDHWPAVWSFTYYVNVSPDCAPLVFPDGNITVKPKNGMMCMFPGWIAHKVPRQKSDHERVMVAGNICHKP